MQIDRYGLAHDYLAGRGWRILFGTDCITASISSASASPCWIVIRPARCARTISRIGRSVILAVRRGYRQMHIIVLAAAAWGTPDGRLVTPNSFYAPHIVSSSGSDKPRYIQARIVGSGNAGQRIEHAGFYLAIRQ